MVSTQDKVRNIYDKIGEEFYLCRDDLKIGGEDFNSTLLFGTLTELNKGNMIIFGEYGGGKTTSAEYFNSIFNGLPLDLIKRSVIRGNPQLTEEKMIGRPDYGKMHEGEEKIVWQNFVLIGPKIIDEFNRIPESNQGILLNGVDRGEWNYLNEFIETGKQPFFATCNYEDRGNNTLIPPILDRFDIAVESKFPGVGNSLFIAQQYDNDQDNVLRNRELRNKALNMLNSGKPYEEIHNKLNKISEEYLSYLESQGVPTLNDEDKIKIYEEITKIQLEKDAEQYLAFLISEMNTSHKYGQKRSNDPNLDKRNGLYLNYAFSGCGSRRHEKALVRYSKSLAWFQGKNKVNLEHITQVAPYVSWHRINWLPEVKSNFKDHDRDDPFDLYIAKNLMDMGTDEFPGVKRRFLESKDNYQRVIDLATHGKIEDAISEAKIFYSNGKGHPIFSEVIKDLYGVV